MEDEEKSSLMLSLFLMKLTGLIIEKDTMKVEQFGQKGGECILNIFTAHMILPLA